MQSENKKIKNNFRLSQSAILLPILNSENLLNYIDYILI